MTLFAQRFAVADPADTLDVPGRYDEARSLRVDACGVPVVDGSSSDTQGARDHGGAARRASAALVHKTTKAERDRPRNGPIDAGTRGGRDRDAYALLLTTKTSAGRDKDAATPLTGAHERVDGPPPMSARS